MLSVTNQFVSRFVQEISFFTNSRTVKRDVGDSVYNHRVPTVRQFIRYLNKFGFGGNLGVEIDAVYEFVREKGLLKQVRRKNNRTDAYDVNEFHKVLTKYVLTNPAIKGQVTKVIKQA